MQELGFYKKQNFHQKNVSSDNMGNQSILGKNSTSWAIKIVDCMQMLKFNQTWQRPNNRIIKKRFKRANEDNDLQELLFKKINLLPASLKFDNYIKPVLSSSDQKTKQEIVELLRKYWKFADNSLLVTVRKEKQFNKGFAYILASRYPGTAEIENKIYDLITKQQIKFLSEKFQPALESFLDTLFKEKRLINFDSDFYLELHSGNGLVKNDKLSVIAYLSFINSVLNPLRSSVLYTKNKLKAEKLYETSHEILGKLDNALNRINQITDDSLENIWKKEPIDTKKQYQQLQIEEGEYKQSFEVLLQNEEIHSLIEYWNGSNNLKKYLKDLKILTKYMICLKGEVIKMKMLYIETFKKVSLIL